MGPLFQPNDFIHAHFKGIFYRLMRERLGWQRNLSLRPSKEGLNIYARSKLLKGLNVPAVAEVAKAKNYVTHLSKVCMKDIKQSCNII